MTKWQRNFLNDRINTRSLPGVWNFTKSNIKKVKIDPDNDEWFSKIKDDKFPKSLSIENPKQIVSGNFIFDF